MRLATIQSPDSPAPAAAVEIPGRGWIEIRGLPIDWRDGGRGDDLAGMLGDLEQIGRAVFDARGESVGEYAHPAIPAIANPKSAIGNFLPPVRRPPSFRDFYAFERHVATCRAHRGLEMDPRWYEQPVFYFSSPGSLIGHDSPVYAPAGCEQLDYELELALVISKPGRDIPAQRAWEHVAGFTIVNDFSARDLQRREMSVGLGPSKGKDFATAVGPWLVTLDELADRIDGDGRIRLQMLGRVNGRELSRGNSGEMHFTWPRIIEHASRDCELLAGDLIASGTVGTGCILELGPEKTGGWLKPGDIVELEIERLGTLRTPIVHRPVKSTPDSVFNHEERPCQCT